MTEGQSLFQDAGPMAPAFDWHKNDPSAVGRSIAGEIVNTKQQQQTKFGTNPPEPVIDYRTGQPKQQLMVVLQTNLRGWAEIPHDGVPKDANGLPLGPEHDTGLRAIYVKGWMIGAVGDAVRAATGTVGPPLIGAKIAVRCTGLGDGTGGKYRKYEAQYQAPAVGAGMGWEQQGQQPPAPPQAPPQQQYAQQPPAQQAPPQQQYAQQPPPQQGYAQAPQQQGPPPQQYAQQPPAQQPVGGDPWAQQAPPSQAIVNDDPWAAAPPY